MRRFLCAAFFVGLVIGQGNAHAQRSSFRGNAEWPDVPEINDESAAALPNSGAERGVRRPPSSNWPETEYRKRASPQPAPATSPGSQSAQQERAPRTSPSEDRAEERTARPSRERFSRPRPVPPVPQRFDQPSTTAGDIDPDQELQPIAGQDAEAVTEQGAELAPIENAAVEERTEAQPDAEAGANPKSEGRQGAVAALEQNTDAPPGAEAAPEQQPVPASPVETPSAQDTQAAQKADAASAHPDKAVQHGEIAQEQNAVAASDGIVGALPVEAETAQGTVAALAPPAPSPPAAQNDDGLGGLIGQMIVTGFDGTTPDEGGVKRLIALLESGKAGGAVITPRNVRSPKQLRALIEALRKANVDVAPFLMVTHEGGDGQSLSAANGFSMYPSAAELGQSNDPLNAFSVYFHMAEELGSYGFNVNLGPVVDLGPKSDAANGEAVSRSYGPAPKHVAAFSKAFRLAHRQENILTVLKYFPRQAGTAAAAPEDRGGVDALLETYRQLVESNNADMVMTSHIIDPAFSDTADRPASLSAKAIQKRLREDVGFKGVVISADMGDAVVAARFPLKERVLGAIGAGSDILLIGDNAPPDDGAVEAIVAIVKEALASGRLSRDQLEASHGRIMSLKRSFGTSGNSIAASAGRGAREPAAAQ